MEMKDDWITYTSKLVRRYWNQWVGRKLIRFVDSDLQDDVVQSVLLEVLEDECVRTWIKDWPLEDNVFNAYKRIVCSMADKYIDRNINCSLTMHQVVVNDEVWEAINHFEKWFVEFERIDYKLDQEVQDKGKKLSDKWVDTRYNDHKYLMWIAAWTALNELQLKDREVVLIYLNEKRKIPFVEFAREYFNDDSVKQIMRIKRAFDRFKEKAIRKYEEYLTNESEQS